MAVFDRDQLETLKRQIEEDYRLDMAAIERLQRRLGFPATNLSPVKNVSVTETRGAVLPMEAPLPEPHSDELTGSLRAMFSTHYK